MTNKIPTGFVSQAEAARYFGVTRQRVCQLIKAGKIKTTKVTDYLLISKREVDRFAAIRRKRDRSPTHR